MTIRRIIANSLLALLLLVSQQLGIAHGISHLSVHGDAGGSHKKHLPAEAHCERCLSFAAIGAALTGASAFLLHSNAGEEAPRLFRHSNPHPAARRLFNPRAPPALI